MKKPLVCVAGLLALLASGSVSATEPPLEGYIVKADEDRKVEGVTRPGRILVGSEDSGNEFVVIDLQGTRTFKTPLHVHHDHHEAVLLITGKSRMTVGDEEFEISEGDFVFAPKGVPHRVEVIEPARVIVIASDGYDESSSRIAELRRSGKSYEEIYEELPDMELVEE